jgi:hypothetical protein
MAFDAVCGARHVYKLQSMTKAHIQVTTIIALLQQYALLTRTKIPRQFILPDRILKHGGIEISLPFREFGYQPHSMSQLVLYLCAVLVQILRRALGLNTHFHRSNLPSVEVQIYNFNITSVIYL